jgi:hypothetical protein
MIRFAPFYKDINPDASHHKKLKRRIGNVDYRKSLKLLYDSFKKFNPHNEFVVQTDQSTDLPYACHRSNLSKFNLMESLVVANLNFVKDHIGKSILVGADNIVLSSVDNFFEDDFDLGFYCIGQKNENEKLNLSNGVVLINSNNSNHDRIVNFFNERHLIYQGYDEQYKSWWGDMLSLNHLLSRKNIIHEFYESNKTKKIYNFDGLKIKIFEIDKEHVKWVNGEGLYNKGEKDILLDFPGDQSVKKYMEIIFNDIKNKKYNI